MLDRLYCKQRCLMKPVILLILDGLGIGKQAQGNPMREVPMPTYDWVKAHFPYFGLQASGIAVGLAWGDAGSSEIGHLTLGTGRIVYQQYPKITMAIQDGTFFKNPEMEKVLSYITQSHGRLHLIGIVSRAKTHASSEHIEALLRAAKDRGVSDVRIHAITDGKESLPHEAKTLLPHIQSLCSSLALGRIASVSGRYYAMDTNEYWQRTETFARFLLEGGKAQSTVMSALDVAYSRGVTDETIEPTGIASSDGTYDSQIRQNDAVVFFNFRDDGMHQIAYALTAPDFPFFPLARPQGVAYAAMTSYGEHVLIPCFFPQDAIAHSLCETLSSANKRCIKICESMKANLVNDYFNGLHRGPFQNEYRISIPSKKISGDVKLQSEELASRLFQAMDEHVYDLLVVNFVHCDAAGHQTDYEKGKQAAAYTDELMNRIIRATLAAHATLIITSDHGNIEQMMNLTTGQPDTAHNDNPVPFMLIDKQWYRDRTSREIALCEREIRGSLADVAPTILDLLRVPIPQEMSGQSLLAQCA